MADKTGLETEIKNTITRYRQILELNGHRPTTMDSYQAVLYLGIEKGRQQVIERGNESCPHSNFPALYRRECRKCWAELQKEAEK